MLEDLDKKELIQLIKKLEKQNNELKEKIYGKIEEKESIKEVKVISNEEKVKLFMEIFKGRTDIYAKDGQAIKQENQAICLYVKMNLAHINVTNLE